MTIKRDDDMVGDQNKTQVSDVNIQLPGMVLQALSSLKNTSMAAKTLIKNSVLTETTCGSLLHYLRLIWDEVGENDTERDKMLLQLEQECLEVYRRKVDKANLSRVQLHQQLADSEAELGINSAVIRPLVPEHIYRTIK